MELLVLLLIRSREVKVLGPTDEVSTLLLGLDTCDSGVELTDVFWV